MREAGFRLRLASGVNPAARASGATNASPTQATFAARHQSAELAMRSEDLVASVTTGLNGAAVGAPRRK
eukprot:5452117-Pyramimonas_sp.AAC.1